MMNNDDQNAVREYLEKMRRQEWAEFAAGYRVHTDAIVEQEDARRLYAANLMGAALAQESDAKRQEMEQELESATRDTTEAIRAKYAQEYPERWNETDADRAMRELAKNLSID